MIWEALIGQNESPPVPPTNQTSARHVFCSTLLAGLTRKSEKITSFQLAFSMRPASMNGRNQGSHDLTDALSLTWQLQQHMLLHFDK